jgi:hypothetical protein
MLVLAVLVYALQQQTRYRASANLSAARCRAARWSTVEPMGSRLPRNADHCEVCTAWALTEAARRAALRARTTPMRLSKAFRRVGQATASIPDEKRQLHPGVPWRELDLLSDSPDADVRSLDLRRAASLDLLPLREALQTLRRRNSCPPVPPCNVAARSAVYLGGFLLSLLVCLLLIQHGMGFPSTAGDAASVVWHVGWSRLTVGRGVAGPGYVLWASLVLLSQLIACRLHSLRPVPLWSDVGLAILIALPTVAELASDLDLISPAPVIGYAIYGGLLLALSASVMRVTIAIVTSLLQRVILALDAMEPRGAGEGSHRTVYWVVRGGAGVLLLYVLALSVSVPWLPDLSAHPATQAWLDVLLAVTAGLFASGLIVLVLAPQREPRWELSGLWPGGVAPQDPGETRDLDRGGLPRVEVRSGADCSNRLSMTADGIPEHGSDDTNGDLARTVTAVALIAVAGVMVGRWFGRNRPSL